MPRMPGGLLPVPARLLQHLQDQLPLGLARRAAGDVLERVVAGFGGRSGHRGRTRAAPACRRGGAEAGGGRPPGARAGRGRRAACASAMLWLISLRIGASPPSTTARLIRFSSSRMLPGQSYSMNSRIVSSPTARDAACCIERSTSSGSVGRGAEFRRAARGAAAG